MLIVLAMSNGIIIQWLRTVAVKKGSVFHFLQYDQMAFIVFWNDKLSYEYTVDFTVILEWNGIMHTLFAKSYFIL